jgi:mono/diheme cytochrome c family protein
MTATAKHLTIAALLLSAWTWRAAAQSGGAYFIPGDAKAGMQLFFDKGCGRCHSILGEGGRSAPDLARAPGGHLSAAELLAGMWNHAPAMWQRMQQENLRVKVLSESDVTDLFAYL